MTAVLRRCLLLLVLAPLALLLAPPAAHADPGLTPAQARTVLQLIDDRCGDTWCEGDDAYRFDSLSCSPPAAGCRLRVHVAWWGSTPLRWYARTAQVHGPSRYADLVRPTPAGPQLRPRFATAVGKALDRVADTIPHMRGSRNSSRLPNGSAA